MNDRNVPASNTSIPFPVDLHRVSEMVDSFGHRFLSSDDRLIIPCTDHRVAMYFSRESGAMLTVLGRMRLTLNMFDINDAARAVTQWNTERIGPTAMIHLGDNGEVEFKFRTTICIDEGLSSHQLRQFLSLALDTTAMASRFMVERFSELSFEGSSSEELSEEQDQADLVEKVRGLFVPPLVNDDENPEYDSDTAATHDEREGENQEMSEDNFDDDYLDDDIEWESEDDFFEPGPDEDIPQEVTLDRIRELLHAIGVSKTSGEEDFIIAWINEIFIGFFVDNGPTFLVKGHWDPNMDPTRDFMKLFMMCNQWNENSLTTKAFCHTDEQGLQVRVEFAVSVAEGLNDDQLQHNIALSIHHILQAIDSISTEATGKSAVDWPEKS